MKRAQIPSQMFTYILTMLVIGMLLFLGVKWVGTIMDRGSDITMAKIKTDMEGAFEDIKYSYGSWKNEEFVLPSEVERVCFFDEEKRKDETYRNTDICTVDDDDYSPTICDSWGQEGSNIVFDPIRSMDAEINVRDIEVDEPGYLCVNETNGRIKVKLTGQGDSVKVSR